MAYPEGSENSNKHDQFLDFVKSNLDPHHSPHKSNMYLKLEIIKCSDVAAIETTLEKISLSYCSRWIPNWQNIVLYTRTRRLKAYAFFDFPVNSLKEYWHCSQSEWSIEDNDRVTYTNSTGEVCSVTNRSCGVEDLFKSLDKHIEKTKNRTVKIETQSFIDIFTICNHNKMIIPNKKEQLTNSERLRNKTTTDIENKLLDDSKSNISGNGQNYCFYTSHLGLPPDSVISLINRKRPAEVQLPQENVVCLVYPLYGTQYNNQATPSYPTQVSEENGHSEITPSFASLPYGQYGEVGNRAEQLHTPSSQTQNLGQNMNINPTHANDSQPVGATNTSNGLRNTDSIRGNDSGHMTYSGTLSPNIPAEPRPPARHPDYREHYPRLLSFTNWPGHVRQDPIHLCQAGFFYTGNADLVRCFQCGIGLKDFRPDDVPLIEHVRYSAECYFLLEILGPSQLAEYKRNVLGDNSNQGTFQQQQQQQQQPYKRQVPNVGASNQYNAQQHQVNTSYGNVPHSRPSDYRSTAMNHTSVTNQHYTTPTSQQEQQQPSNNGPIPPNTATGVTYRHPEYALLDTRLASFTKWPPGIMQTPRQISEAGFYYTGMSDVVRCWACDGGLQKWDPQDDPWVEHCYYFPTCPYAIQQKGSGYIALIQQQARRQTPNEGHQHIATTNSSVAQINSSASSINDDLHKLTIEEHDPVLSTVAEQSLQEMGYGEKKIKRAFEKLRGQGITKPTAEQIVDIIEGGDGNIPNNKPQQSNEMHRSTSAVLHENERLKSLLLCMICNENNVNVLFLPCTHHRMCTVCAKTVTHCPLCNKFIQEKVKTYMS